MAFLLNLESSESVNHTLCDFDFQLYGNLYAKVYLLQQETSSAEQASSRGSYRHLNRMNYYRRHLAISSRKIGHLESLPIDLACVLFGPYIPTLSLFFTLSLEEIQCDNQFSWGTVCIKIHYWQTFRKVWGFTNLVNTACLHCPLH